MLWPPSSSRASTSEASLTVAIAARTSVEVRRKNCSETATRAADTENKGRDGRGSTRAIARGKEEWLLRLDSNQQPSG